jgi:hypothetical protein
LNIRIALFALCFAASTGTLYADDLPSAQTILANHEKAVGPDHDTYREVVVFHNQSISGTRTYVQRGKDYRESTVGPNENTLSGEYKGDSWFQNENGHTVIDEPDPGLATKDVYTTTVSRVHTPVDAYVIADLNVRKAGTLDYYDPVTWLRIRHEEVGTAGRAITTYDHFQHIGDETLAMHWVTHDERDGLDTESTRTEYRTTDISDADVAIPDNRQLLVEFPLTKNTVQLPARFLDNGHIVIRVSSAGQNFDFLLDTGASSMAIDPIVAKKLNLPITNRYVNSVNAGRIQSGTVVVPELKVGDLTMHDLIATSVPSGFDEDLSIKTVGLLGFDFICEMGITIDYVHHTVTAQRYGTYQPPTDPHTVTMPVRLGSEAPLATVKINDALAERMLLDTGGGGAVLIFDYFRRRHPEALVDHNHIGANSPEIDFEGIGGRIGTRAVAFDRFQLGNVLFRDFVGYVVTSDSYAETDEDGAIGPDFLKYFDIHLDYPNGTIYLVPNQFARDARH